jgi:hypothetical protein
MIFYLVTCKSHPVAPTLAASIPGHTISTYSIPLITLLPSDILIYTSIRALLWREIDPDDDLGGCWTQIIVLALFAYIYTFLNFALAFFHFVPQFLAILRTKSGGGLSILSVGAQISTLFLLALAVGRRVLTWQREMLPESEDLNDVERLVSFSKLRMKKALVWYFCGGNVPFGYGVMAAGQAVLFVLCLWYRHHDGIRFERTYRSPGHRGSCPRVSDMEPQSTWAN